jgi:DNA-binding transcriptional LysR family regulator
MISNIASLDVRLLHWFDILMSERSVSRAAQRLNVSQPAMSLVLRRLRRIFQDPLFVRAHNEMVPTPRALELVVPIRRILEELGALVEGDASFDPQTSSGQFTITAPGYISFLLLPRLIRRMEKKAPGISFEIRAANRERAIEWLEKGEIDFRIGWIKEPHDTLRFKTLYRDQFVCLARKGHPEVGRKLTLERLCAIPHVRAMVHKDSDSGKLIDQALEAHGMRIKIALLVQDSLIVPYVVANSNLIAVLPARLAQGIARQLPIRIWPVPIKLPEQSIALYWHERTHKDAAHEWMRTQISDVCRGI